jgi:hypothetical protein
MREPRRLTTLWAFTACYRDSFAFFASVYVIALISAKLIATLWTPQAHPRIFRVGGSRIFSYGFTFKLLNIFADRPSVVVLCNETQMAPQAVFKIPH